MLKKSFLLCYNFFAKNTQKGNSLFNDNIKYLNFEAIAHLITTLDITKDNNILFCHIVLKKQSMNCPVCGSIQCIVHDYQPKKIVHSVSTSSPCFLLYKARRYRCKLCHKIFYEDNPFVPNQSKSSTYTILSVLHSLRSHTSTFTSVAKTFNLSKQTVMNIFDSYVDCSKKPFPSVICIDEFYTAKVSSAKYACVVVDFLSKQICEIYRSRHMYYLANKFTTLPDNERNNVKAVVIDMWETYKDLTKRYFKNAIIAVDSFHVIRHLNDALIKIRIKVMMRFYHQTSKLVHNEMYYYMLKKFHYFFVKNFDDIYDGDIKIPKINAKWKKQAILKYLLSIDDDLKYAYFLKEKYREFNATAIYDSCDQEFDDLINEFCNSHLSEMRIFGKMLLNWKIEIKNSFIRIDNRRLSNGAIEGINSRIKTIIKNANGFNNFNRLRNKIMYSLNHNEPILNTPKKLD